MPDESAAALASEPEVYAAVDIGTNSVHMVIARISDHNRMEILTKEKATIRLGSGLDAKRVLSAEAIERGLAAVDRCARLAAERQAHVAAVATSALRDAVNRQEFLDEAKARSGVDISVISGREEARLIYLGVVQSLQVYDRPLVLIDIGGGSTEVLFGLEDNVHAARSFKLGAIRTTREFFADGIDEKSVAKCRGAIRTMVAPFRKKVGGFDVDVAVGSSGTIETIAAMALANSGEYPNTLNAAEVSRRAVSAVVASLLAEPDAEHRASLPGIDPSRADIVVAGALILETLMAMFGIDRITVSEGALREGLLVDTWRRRTGSDLRHLTDLRRYSVEHLLARCDDDPAHAKTVAHLAVELFDDLVPLTGMGKEPRELLWAAAMLSNVGQVISHSKHHVHAYYVIRNSESLQGFSEREIAMIALVARFHRRNLPSEESVPEFAALSLVDRAVVRMLVAILRVAIGLDRSHSGAVGEVAADIRPDVVRILVVPATEDTNVDLELYAARARVPYLAEILGRPCTIEAANVESVQPDRT